VLLLGSKQFSQLLDRQPRTLQNRPERSGTDVFAFVHRYHSDAALIISMHEHQMAALLVRFDEASPSERTNQPLRADLGRPRHAAETSITFTSVRASGAGLPNLWSPST